MAGFALRVFLLNFGTLSLDFNTFLAWGNQLSKIGFLGFYNNWSDYLPGYLYVLWFLAKIRSLNLIPDVLLYKLPAILADIVTGWFIFSIVRKLKNEKWGLITAALYIFNPAIIANSTLWGQIDSLTALFSLLTVYFAGSSPYLSAIFLSVGTLIKPQAVFLAPVVLFIALKNKWNYRKILLYLSIAFIIFVLGFAPFAGKNNVFLFIIERLGVSLNQYPYISVNAFNFWGLFGLWGKETLGQQLFGYGLVAGISIIAAIKLWKKENSEYLLSTIIFLSSFLFFTRIHERHLLPVFAPLVISAAGMPILLLPYLGLSATYVANLYYSYKWITSNFLTVFSPTLIKILILSNIFFFAEIIFRLFKRTKEKAVLIQKLPVRNAKAWLLIILVFAFVTRVLFLGSPAKEYFDEVYHAFTARQILHGNNMAWEWWNTPPKGFAYEWTHPPLAKLGMVLGMLVFGENSFGWRIPGALLGVGSVYLVYLIAKKLFDDEEIALLSAGFFALDGLPLVMSRIGMNDSYILFFALLSIYLFLKQKNLFSAIALGLALSSKWSALWAIPILGLLNLQRKNKFEKGLLWFVVLVPAVYLAIYIPFFLSGHDFNTFIGLQKQMWWYHTRLKATHPYMSTWWEWPFLIRPIYLYTSGYANGIVANIYAMGNPAVFWGGLVAVIWGIYYAYINKIKSLGVVIFSYLVFFVPWALSPRIMFLYHYLPSIPFLAIATGYFLKRTPKLIVPFFLVAGVLFIYFYPHWAGITIPQSLDSSYYWFPSWR